jgi:hypothetical protein
MLGFRDAASMRPAGSVCGKAVRVRLLYDARRCIAMMNSGGDRALRCSVSARFHTWARTSVDNPDLSKKPRAISPTLMLVLQAWKVPIAAQLTGEHAIFGARCLE